MSNLFPSDLSQSEINARGKLLALNDRPGIFRCQFCNIYISTINQCNASNASDHISTPHHRNTLNNKTVTSLVKPNIRNIPAIKSDPTLIAHMIDKKFKNDSVWCCRCHKRLTARKDKISQHLDSKSHKDSGKKNNELLLESHQEEFENIHPNRLRCKVCFTDISFGNIAKHMKGEMHASILRFKSDPESFADMQNVDGNDEFSGPRKKYRIDQMAKIVNDFKSKGIVVEQIDGNPKYFCKFCSKFYEWKQKTEITDHIGTDKHRNNSPYLHGHIPNDLYKAWVELSITMGWSIAAVNKKIFRDFMKKFCDVDFPSSVTLENKYLDEISIQCADYVRHNFGNDQIWLGYDETQDAAGRIVAGITVGSITCPEKDVFLLDYHELSDTRAETFARGFIKGVTDFFTNETKESLNARTLILMSDSAGSMGRMVKDLKKSGWFSKAVHMNCGAHKLHNLASKIKDEYSDLNDIMMAAKSVFVKAPKRRLFFKQNGYSMAPKFSHIRWGTFIRASEFYTDEENVESLRDGLLELSRSDSAKSQNIQTAIDLLQDIPKIVEQALEIKVHFGQLPYYIEQLQSKKTNIYQVETIFGKVEDSIQKMPVGDIRTNLMKYYSKIMNKNKGLNLILNFLNTGNTDSTLDDWSEEDMHLIENIPSANDDIERMFSISKAFLRSNRHRFLFSNLRKQLLINVTMNKINKLSTKAAKRANLANEDQSNQLVDYQPDVVLENISEEFYYDDEIDEIEDFDYMPVGWEDID